MKTIWSCGICSGRMIDIRGRHPYSDRRIVCPTCLADKMDLIRDITDRDYGQAFSEKSSVAPKLVKNNCAG